MGFNSLSVFSFPQFCCQQLGTSAKQLKDGSAYCLNPGWKQTLQRDTSNDLKSRIRPQYLTDTQTTSKSDLFILGFVLRVAEVLNTNSPSGLGFYSSSFPQSWPDPLAQLSSMANYRQDSKPVLPSHWVSE
jgi:hypothetical protein